ncbi:MAG: aminotransferase class I/II-fold pyridoxal phosphate-dependent enzyme [Thermodesulfobacteriota bacterium]
MTGRNPFLQETFKSRPERWEPAGEEPIESRLRIGATETIGLEVTCISETGMEGRPVFKIPESVRGKEITEIQIRCNGHRLSFGPGKFAPGGLHSADRTVGICFDANQSDQLALLRPHLRPRSYVTHELRDEVLEAMTTSINGLKHSLTDFYRIDSPDVFEKCNRFYEMIKDLQKNKYYQGLYRVTLTSGIGPRITVFNPSRRREEPMICYDSNSYLGLHRHPRVLAVVDRTLRVAGYGTPSSQLLSGTNKYLRTLEETVAAFHQREDCIIFPTGYAANIGAISALIRDRDLIVRDRFAHNSIRNGTLSARSPHVAVYPHQDYDSLEEILSSAGGNPEIIGKMIVTDAVFSMHGSVADLPRLAALSKKHNARLMLDEAHSIGVLGETGHGIEEHYGMTGAVDVLMGTLSKTPGSLGGYVAGCRELVTYLRHYAQSGMFTTSLPAAICAGVTEAFHVMEEEPEHRERLWNNIRRLTAAIHDAGLLVSPPRSSIITVSVGELGLLWLVSQELFQAGIKAGSVTYPAVARGESILRLSVTAQHTAEDIDYTAGTLKAIGRKYGLCGKSLAELNEMSERYRLGAD